MLVDKFERNGNRTTTVYTEINIVNLTNTFLRRDGGNTAIGAIDRTKLIELIRIDRIDRTEFN